MKQPSFPLFRPAIPEDLEGMVFGVSDVIAQEVRRAAFEGPDPEAVERVRFTLDLHSPMEQMLQALATAVGSSRRAMAAKLLTGAILDAVNTLQRGSESDPETGAVFEEFRDALDKLRKDAGP